MTKTKIEWCDYTWNPVWGCRTDCPYCYARKLAHRFGESFKPHWKQKNFDKPFPKKPSRIYVNSMSDIDWWEADWMLRVLDRIDRDRYNTFIFLTKRQSIYSQYDFPSNCWLGITATRDEDLKYKIIMASSCSFVSLEPLHERINFALVSAYEWVIIGAETGNRKGKIIPRREWITEIVDYCRSYQIPVFLKDSLREIWGGELIQEFPEGT